MARILLVDDEIVCTTWLAAALGDDGHEVRCAASAQEAEVIAHELRPEILITDWSLRGPISGSELARRVRVMCPNLAVIVVTGFTAEEITDGEGPGPLRILEKPIELTELRAAVADAGGMPPTPP